MSAYKQYRHKNRNMMVEEVFTLGMNYTNTPMPEGFSRAMVNYDIKDNGQILVDNLN